MSEHWAGSDDPAGAKRPTLQSRHCDTFVPPAVAMYVFTGQFLHEKTEVPPLVSWNVPGGQSVGTVVPRWLQNAPMGHEAQSDAFAAPVRDAFMYDPGGHRKRQVVWPPSGL